MIHPRNESTNRFPIFEELTKTVEYSTVLDYGGGSGNLLYFSNGKILETNYTCIDVSYDAIESGKKEFPKSNWFYYNKFNSMYSHNGLDQIEYPDVDKNQDIIWSYSVMSHMDADEIISTIEWLNTFNYKKMFLSFLDIHNKEMKQFFYNKRVSEYGHCAQNFLTIDCEDLNCFYFFDNNKIETNKYKCTKARVNHFLSFYNTTWLTNELKKKNINAKVIKPSVGYVPFLVIEK